MRCPVASRILGTQSGSARPQHIAFPKGNVCCAGNGSTDGLELDANLGKPLEWGISGSRR